MTERTIISQRNAAYEVLPVLPARKPQAFDGLKAADQQRLGVRFLWSPDPTEYAVGTAVEIPSSPALLYTLVHHLLRFRLSALLV